VLLVGVDCALSADSGSPLGELGVDRRDEVATVVVADHRGDCLEVEADTAVIHGVDHPLDRAVLELVELLAGHAEQFNAATRKFDTPKNHLQREAPLTAHARTALEALAPESEFCFVSLRGEHWTPSSLAYHWKAVRAAAGWEGSLNLATRHFAGWYMVDVLEMPSEDVAIALGHQDGGNLVRRLYGHRDGHRALDCIVGAYAMHAGESHPKAPGSSAPDDAQKRLF
jgi:hypothetical protein